MVLWTAKDAAKASDGVVSSDWVATGISIDSRTINKGDLFIALKGDQGDGHVYVRDALSKGAAAAMVTNIPEGVDAEKCLIVKDTLVAMQDLGVTARERCGGIIVGITGSVGKTGTKDMLAAAFSSYGQTHASKKSYNNHWGVPLSLSQMDAGSDTGVFEMGMNHAGEISHLTKMVRPHIAIITSITPSHVEAFDNGEEGIANAKAEIFEGLEPFGDAILNRDNEWFDHLKQKAESKDIRVRSFGEHKESDACLIDCLVAANGSRVIADIMGEKIEYNLQIAGRHIVQNSLAVLLAVKLAGGDLKKAAGALARVEPPTGRGGRESINWGKPNNPVTLIDESYNASPSAMKAAFKVMALIDPGRGGRRIAVLGDMYELGAKAADIHRDLALPLQAADVQLVYTSGPLMKNLYNALPEEKRGAHHDDSVELAKIVPEVLVPGDVVMVKGSRGGGEKPRMQLIVEALRAFPGKIKSKKQANE